MHLSLKGSLIRSPMLNRVGQRLLQLFEGASAAYSLRDLASNIASVVRVRRASDNSEKDFSAADVSSGAMTQWVNAQIVTPLDVRELVDGERTGDLVEAAAAYSLRNLSTSYTGDVVEVRRNTDGATLDFSAAEVADGTLTDWVNTSFADALPLDTASGAAAAYSLRNLSTSYTGNVVDVRRSSDDAEESFTAAEVADGTLEDWVGAGNDGFVTQWYDQSGNGNHATQGTDASQPKIVDGGSLVSGGLDFDGVDDFLELGDLGLSQPNSVVFVHNSDTAGGSNTLKNDFLDGIAISSGRTLIDQSGAFYRIFAGGDATGTSKTIVANQDALVFTTLNGSSSEFALDGSNETALNSGTNSMDEMTLGASISGGRYDGTFAEFIIYNSDQSDKRQAIEENIGSNYGITLTSSKDGTVSTWYDQSGNGNDATQTDAAKQPKIVEGGSLVSGGLDFDGVNDKLSFDSSVSLSTNDFYFASVISILDGNREDIAPVGNAAGNRFLISLDYDNDRAQMRANDGTFLTQPFTRTVPANETLISISTVSNTATLRCEGISAAVFNTTGESFTLGSMGQRTPSAYSKHSIKELIIYTSDQSDNRTAFEANIGETYGIDLPSGVDTGYDQVDGFVETWYDQSGHVNDAVQQVSGKQPKIVDAGSLVRDSKNNPAINFDDIDDNMDLTSGLAAGGVYSCIAYHEFTTPTIIIKGDLNVPRIRLQNNTTYQIGSYAPEVNQNFTVASTLGLVSVLKDASHNARVYANGTESSSGQQNVGSGSQPFTMLGTNVNDGAGDGKIVELLYYNSDQSANRPAIEANINNQYDIY